LPLRRRQGAFIDQAPFTQIVDRLVDPVAVGAVFGLRVGQGSFGKKHIVANIDRGKIIADHGHHRIDYKIPDRREPLVFRLVHQRGTMFARQRDANRLQIVSGVQSFGDFADIFAKRLAVAQECRPGQNIDLGAGIVDIIFPRNIISGEIKQIGKRIPEDRAAAMADMHRTCRIGRNIFHVDLLAAADLRPAEIDPGFQDFQECA